jgi:hypothetical protein
MRFETFALGKMWIGISWFVTLCSFEGTYRLHLQCTPSCLMKMCQLARELLWVTHGHAHTKILFSRYIVRSLTKLNATVTSRLPAGTATKGKLILLFFWSDAWLVSGKRVALGGESCSSSREVTVALKIYQWRHWSIHIKKIRRTVDLVRWYILRCVYVQLFDLNVEKIYGLSHIWICARILLLGCPCMRPWAYRTQRFTSKAFPLAIRFICRYQTTHVIWIMFVIHTGHLVLLG